MNTNSSPEISAATPDWERERPRRFWDPGRKLLLAIRAYQRWKKKKGLFPFLMCKYCVFRHVFWSIVTGADIQLDSSIGGGLLIPHPNGIVIHPRAEIGVNCLIHQQVTIGRKISSGVPKIEGHVDIGAGAKVLGAITICKHAQIGANAVVTHDVNSYDVVVGIPAKVIKKSIPN